MFTLEIDGRAIAVTDASEKDAKDLLESIAEELIDLESEGGMIWDGTSPLTIRRATDEEVAAFDEAEMDEEDEEDDEDPVVVFLIDIDGLEEDDEDED
ncbi:hypothetical protein [Salinarimonas sp.]|uniref:hypothetical protein n=1 Tax=Salinarimonas sp. TaxID=2766526 RepID=UPI003918AEE3